MAAGFKKQKNTQDYFFTTFAACRPFGPWVISNVTASPSASDLKPSPPIAEK
jgi:hypothetical protein